MADGESHPGDNPRKVSIMSQPAKYTADPVTHYARNVLLHNGPITSQFSM